MIMMTRGKRKSEQSVKRISISSRVAPVESVASTIADLSWAVITSRSRNIIMVIILLLLFSLPQDDKDNNSSCNSNK